MTTHSISPHRATLHGTFSPTWPAVLTIEPGDTVVFETLDARWTIGDPPDDHTLGATFAPKDPERDNGRALCGPIAIDGAEPGMVLAVEIGELVPGPHGWTVGGGWSNGINERLGMQDEELLLSWQIDHGEGVAIDQFGRSVELRPFFGGDGHAENVNGAGSLLDAEATGRKYRLQGTQCRNDVVLANRGSRWAILGGGWSRTARGRRGFIDGDRVSICLGGAYLFAAQ